MIIKRRISKTNYFAFFDFIFSIKNNVTAYGRAKADKKINTQKAREKIATKSKNPAVYINCV